MLDCLDDISNFKECTKCYNILNITKFQVLNKKKGYRHSYCTNCENNRKKQWRQTPLWKISDKKSRLKHVYKISIQDYNILSEKQNKKCYICKEEKQLHIDHCHITNKVRKLLCEECNRYVGYYENVKLNIEIYEKYVKEHEQC